MAGIIGQGNIVKNGLVLNLDAANPRSYAPPYNGTLWRDISGNNNNGTLTNGPTFNSSNGGSIVFDGVNDYVNCGNNTSLRMGTGDFTVSVWVRLNNPPNTYGNPFINIIITSKNALAASAGYGIVFFYGGTNANKLLFSTGNGSTAVEILTQNAFPQILGAWANIVMVRQNNSTNNGCFYVNGQLQPLASTANIINVNTTTNMTIGNSADLFSSYWTNGTYSQTLIYNRALSASEIQQNFNATRGRFGI
jgi:hypothetical protein